MLDLDYASLASENAVIWKWLGFFGEFVRKLYPGMRMQ
jgi:hypothetical protein